MRLGKRLLKAPAMQRFLARLAAGYLDFVARRTRWSREMPTATRALLEAEAPVIYCFWHGRLAIMADAWPGRPGNFHLLISGHRDGLLIARAVEHRGYRVIAGSSRRGGAIALRAVLAVLAAGRAVGITPDGPRGPRMRVKAGAVRAARDAGVPLVAVTGAVARQKRLGSWDRFALPLPPTEGLLLYGAPLSVPADADADLCQDIARTLEAELNSLTEAADARFGHDPVAPDARP